MCISKFHDLSISSTKKQPYFVPLEVDEDKFKLLADIPELEFDIFASAEVV